MEITKQLLLNLSLLLVLLFFFQFKYERQDMPPSEYNYSVYFTISLMICFFLSNPYSDGFYFDLRQIPLTLGGLYSGIFSSIWLFGITILFRSISGIDIGFWVTFIVFFVQTIITCLLHSRFTKLNINRKILFSSCLSIIPSIWWILTQISHGNKINVEFLISYLFIPVIGTFIITYTIESINKNVIIRKEVINSKKLEVVSHFSASISHEVRNPLAATRGFLQLMQDPTLSIDNKNEYAKIAIIELDRAERIISDYLMFAKPAQSNTVGTIDVLDVLNDIVKVVTPLANMNSVKVTKTLESGLTLYGDANKFHQAILNIIKNAIEAMPNSGTLQLSSYESDTTISIIINDTGKGMSKEETQRLGEPYFTTKGSKGTGLGMMVTYSIISSMGGKINVQSEAGIGTTFILIFPKLDNFDKINVKAV